MIHSDQTIDVFANIRGTTLNTKRERGLGSGLAWSVGEGICAFEKRKNDDTTGEQSKSVTAAAVELMMTSAFLLALLLYSSNRTSAVSGLNAAIPVHVSLLS